MKKELNTPDEKPPVLKSWRNMYLLVLINLGVMILIFYLMTIYLK